MRIMVLFSKVRTQITDLIKCADYVIDLGPDGGAEGGYLVAAGTPEEVAKVKKSHTAPFIAEKLN